MVKNPDGTFSRTFKDGTRINFGAQGLHTSTTDRNGNTTMHQYDAQERLELITDPVGMETTVTYNSSGFAITDPAGRITSFQHDGAGDLTQVTFPDGTTKSFGYEERHLMTSETDQRGSGVRRQYDALGRFTGGTRKDQTTVSATNIQAVGFVDLTTGVGSKTNPAPFVRPSAALSTLKDGAENVTSFGTDRFGGTTRQVDALGQVTLIGKSENGNPTKITRPNGAVLFMTYDDKGNLLTSTNPLSAVTTFTYDSLFNQVTSIKDPKGNTTTIDHDAKGNPIEIEDALQNKTQMTYDSRGLLKSVTSGVGTAEENTTLFDYDSLGNLVKTTDPLGNATLLKYDGAGNVSKSTDGEQRVTDFVYDSMNRLETVSDALQGLTRYEYDLNGNLVKVVDANQQPTFFEYDEMDRLISSTNVLQDEETFKYDANGNLVSTTNRNDQNLSFDYDALNRLIKKTLDPALSQVGPQVTTFGYDTVGNLVSVANPATTVSMQYDLANRLISSNSSDEEILSGAVTVIDEDTTIDANNREFEGKTLQVAGKTLTLDGSHTFANLVLSNGAVLTHSPTTATTVGKLDIRVTGI